MCSKSTVIPDRLWLWLWLWVRLREALVCLTTFFSFFALYSLSGPTLCNLLVHLRVTLTQRPELRPPSVNPDSENVT